MRDLDLWYADLIRTYTTRQKVDRPSANQHAVHLQEGFEYALTSWESFGKKLIISAFHLNYTTMKTKDFPPASGLY